VTSKVYNVLGNEVATLVNERKIGSYSVQFKGEILRGYILQIGS
jgi:hypothetical protein